MRRHASSRAIGCALLLASAATYAQGVVTLAFGHQKIFTYKATLRSSESSDPAIVETHVLRDDQVLVTANGIGKATITVSFKKAPPRTFAVEVIGRRLTEVAADERIEIFQGDDDCLKHPKCTDLRFQLDGETGFESSAPEVVKPLVVGRELRIVFVGPGQATVRWTSRAGTHSMPVVVHPRP